MSEPKFKVGDRVRVVRGFLGSITKVGPQLGDEAVVAEVQPYEGDLGGYCIRLGNPGEIGVYWHESRFERVNRYGFSTLTEAECEAVAAAVARVKQEEADAAAAEKRRLKPGDVVKTSGSLYLYYVVVDELGSLYTVDLRTHRVKRMAMDYLLPSETKITLRDAVEAL